MGGKLFLLPEFRQNARLRPEGKRFENQMESRVATQRAVMELGYAGDVTPRYAWDALHARDAAQFIDVRTPPEWSFSGTPDLTSIGKRAILISYKLYPEMSVNPDFLAQLERAVPDKTTPLYFMCRGGVRSLDAAKLAASAGWLHSYNVTSGFDGTANEKRQRGLTDGWRASGLPWIHP